MPRFQASCPALLAAALAAACAPGDEAGATDTTGTRPAPEAGGAAWFRDASDEVGLDFVHEAGGSGSYLMPEIMGAGVALFDADGDQDLDLFFTNGHAALPAPTAEGPPDRLFLQGPDGRFADATEASGLGGGGYGMGAAVADIDNDGDLDVYVTNAGPDRLYRNEGGARFVDVSEEAGIGVDGWSSSAAFLDYDRDGLLDLFVAQYVTYDPDKRCFDGAARPDYCGPKEFPPLPSVLLHNEGSGRFRDVSREAGIAARAAAGLGVVCEDVDQDGWIDVYVANDAYPNHLWINQGDGTFVDEALERGCAYNLSGQAEAGMGVVCEDFDGNGHSDFFVTHLAQESNTLYLNQGASGFSDSTGRSGLGPSSMRFTGFGVVAFDADLDGELDIAVANGRVFRGEPIAGALVPPPWDRYAEPNLFYVGLGGGRFRLADDEARAFTAPVEISRGLVEGDVDRDGDLDLVVANIEGPARLYRNEAPRRGGWLVVRALDPALRRDAIGARVEVVCGGRTLRRTIRAGASYLSSAPSVAHFGLGAAREVEAVRVRWPDGVEETFPGGPADRALVLERGKGRQ